MEELNKTLFDKSQKAIEGVLQSRNLFRRAGGRYDTISPKFSDTDTPATLYFKIFFCFRNGRLLDITDPNVDHKYTGFQIDKADGIKSIDQNSALNYLYTNGEFERARLLRQFIILLSNINTYSPWYFQSINGLDQILSRANLVSGRDFVADDPKIISIKCLPDAYDNRIGTLLDLYRAACFSQRLHKQIVPANLRKFDMIVYLFNSPIKGVTGNIVQDPTGHTLGVSSKMIEIDNCEIEIDSSSALYSDISNSDGFEPEYTISIKCGNVLEQRYNSFLNTYIGDLIKWDTVYDMRIEHYSGETTSDGEGGTRLLNSEEIDEKHRGNIMSQMYDERQKYLDDDWIEAFENTPVISIPAEPRSMLGSSSKTRSEQVYGWLKQNGLDSVMDKADKKVKEVIAKYSPNIKGRLKGITSGARKKLTQEISGALNDAINDITFGNLYHHSSKPNDFAHQGFNKYSGAISSAINSEISGIYDEAPDVNRKSPSSSIGKNLYEKDNGRPKVKIVENLPNRNIYKGWVKH